MSEQEERMDKKFAVDSESIKITPAQGEQESSATDDTEGDK